MKEQHELLLVTIGGIFDEEEYAYWLVTEFSWILPTIVLCGGLLDLLLIGFYMKFAHPWKGILSGEESLKENETASVSGLVKAHTISEVIEDDENKNQNTEAFMCCPMIRMTQKNWNEF